MAYYTDSPPPSWYDPPADAPCRHCWIEQGFDMSLYDDDEGRLCKYHAKLAYAEDQSEAYDEYA